jgi:hypothetical protein
MVKKSVRARPPTAEDSARAREAGKRAHQFDGAHLTYHPRSDELDLELVNGLRVLIPRRLVAELVDLPVSIVKEVRLGVQGGAIEVRSQDIDISVRGLLRDLVGANIATLGGRAKTPAKAAAARANGRLGGRPRKRDKAIA